MKNKILFRVGAVLIACLILFAGFQIYWRLTDPVGYKNCKLCGKIPKEDMFIKSALDSPF